MSNNQKIRIKIDGWFYSSEIPKYWMIDYHPEEGIGYVIQVDKITMELE